MSIELFEHDHTAYKAASAVLVETGKAAVIHPHQYGKVLCKLQALRG